MDKFIKKIKVNELKDGIIVNDVFFVKFKKGMKAYKNGYFFELTLSDNSGANIDYKYWGPGDELSVKSLYDSISADSIVNIQAPAKISTYNNKLELGSNDKNSIRVLKEGEYEISDFIRKSSKNIESMMDEVLKFIALVEDINIKKLLDSLFGNPVFQNKFKNHPGAIEIHHGWVGGLMEHTLEVAKYCKASWEIYPKLNKDLLIAGALMHDLGKMEELTTTTRIKGTVTGQLVGHLILGAIFVSNKCDELSINGDLKSKLLHIISSHHGKLEYGAPKEPMFPEAVVIYYADELSSKISEMIEFVDSSKESTEDDFMFHKRSLKNIFLK
ncbi:MAG: HD domain-containing protein [Candidatus Nanoarchaeia archaeon]|nr:HD domain-containing protein [Candidatus Nanoarchaeia archaeon]